MLGLCKVGIVAAVGLFGLMRVYSEGASCSRLLLIAHVIFGSSLRLEVRVCNEVANILLLLKLLVGGLV